MGPQPGEGAGEGGWIVLRLETRRSEVAQHRIVARAVGVVDRRHRAPHQPKLGQATRQRPNARRDGGRRGRGRPGLGQRRQASRQPESQNDRRGRGMEPRRRATRAHHAFWKPARAPNSPDWKPMPTPAENEVLAPSLAEKAALAADWFW